MSFRKLLLLAILSANLFGWPQVTKDQNTASDTNAQTAKDAKRVVPPTHVVIDPPFPAFNNSQPPAPENQTEAPEKPLPRFLRPEWVIVYVTAIYSLIAGLTLWAIKRQADTMETQATEGRESAAKATELAKQTADAASLAANAAQKSADAAMAGQRAYVAATAYWALNGATHARFGVIMRNVGNLPTRRLRNYIDFVITSGDLPEDFKFPINEPPLATGTLLVPKDQVYGPHIPKDGDGLAQSDLGAIRKGEKNLYFFGWMKYFDGFPETPERITEFCYQLRVTGDSKQPFTFIPYRKYNCADEGCEDCNPQNPN